MQYPEPIILAWVSMFFSSNQCESLAIAQTDQYFLAVTAFTGQKLEIHPLSSDLPYSPWFFDVYAWFCFVFFDFLLQNYVLFSGTCTFVEADSHDLCTYATPAYEKSGVQNETSDEIQTAESREDGNG